MAGLTFVHAMRKLLAGGVASMGTAIFKSVQYQELSLNLFLKLVTCRTITCGLVTSAMIFIVNTGE